jgi:glycosyl hydrolase family 32
VFAVHQSTRRCGRLAWRYNAFHVDCRVFYRSLPPPVPFHAAARVVAGDHAGALQALRREAAVWLDETITPGTNLLASLSGGAFEVIAEFQFDQAAPVQRFGLRLNAADGPATTIGYDPQARLVFVERGVCGVTPFSAEFGGVHTAALEPRGRVVALKDYRFQPAEITPLAVD